LDAGEGMETEREEERDERNFFHPDSKYDDPTVFGIDYRCAPPPLPLL
jgi:hypothetical protein